MRFFCNIIWLVFGGIEISLGYFSASLVLAITIIGLPWAFQTVKLGLLCLWPFGTELSRKSVAPVSIVLNLIWFVFGGWWIFLGHLFVGMLSCITIIGLPWGIQHLKMCKLGFAPFGMDVRFFVT